MRESAVALPGWRRWVPWRGPATAADGALTRIVHAVWVWAARRSTEVPAQQGKLGLATVQVVPAERHSVGEAYFVVDRLVRDW